MKWITAIGAPSTGKTHFSNQLSALTGIEVTHMDMLYWNAEKTPVSRDVFRQRLLNVLHRDEWILDGTYNQTMDLWRHHCDTVFFLDYSMETALDGLERQRGRPRNDVPWEASTHHRKWNSSLRNCRRRCAPRSSISSVRLTTSPCMSFQPALKLTVLWGSTAPLGVTRLTPFSQPI
ncbi:hypothetical protein [Corynebacterium cystitidis]|uniref:hypothetical protein n=1 Tax=Corynebacterium cystitidis TaxID=35757 RepID=UPI00211E50F8|nr:hypothetical protein [Corynebacterium cystitidis]